MRIVLTVPKEQMKEACNRIVSFCQKYYVPSIKSNCINNLSLNEKMQLSDSITETMEMDDEVSLEIPGIGNTHVCNGK